MRSAKECVTTYLSNFVARLELKVIDGRVSYQYQTLVCLTVVPFFLIYWMVVHGRSVLVGYPVRLIPVTSEIPSMCLSCVSSVLLGGKSTVATNE